MECRCLNVSPSTGHAIGARARLRGLPCADLVPSSVPALLRARSRFRFVGPCALERCLRAPKLPCDVNLLRFELLHGCSARLPIAQSVVYAQALLSQLIGVTLCTVENHGARPTAESGVDSLLLQLHTAECELHAWSCRSYLLLAARTPRTSTRREGSTSGEAFAGRT
jgi:hypothetical protein